MKANEYIKEYGLDIAKKAVSECTYGYGIDLIELKRLVESHELVARYGTADEAKEYLPMLRMDSYDELKQAILDVESCQ